MATIKSGLEPVHPFSFAALNGHLYMSNGWDPMLRYNGVETAAKDAGIKTAPDDWAPAPAGAAGSTTTGKHLFRYRYKSRDTAYISNHSNQKELTVLATQEALTFPISTTSGVNIQRSTDPKADQIVIEMTLVNGSKFFEAVIGDNSASSIVLDLSDDKLAGKLIDYADEGHDPPEFFNIVIAHKGRLLGAGKVKHEIGTVDVTNGSDTVTGTTTNWTQAGLSQFFKVDGDTEYYKIKTVGSATSITLETNYAGSTASAVDYAIFSVSHNVIRESLTLFPESWPPLRFAKALVNKNDRIRAMISHFGNVLVMGDRNTEKWAYTKSLVKDGQPYPIPGNRGAINNRCVVEVDGIVYGWDHQGVWRYNGGPQQHISHAVDPLLQIMNWGVPEQFHCVFIPIERTLRFYFPRDDDDVTDTRSRDFLEFNIDKNIWATGRHLMAITSSTTIGTGNERRAILGDENGHTWFVVGSTEGADPSGTLEGTVDSSPTPTATVFGIVGGGLVTTNGGLAGVPIFDPKQNEEQLCSSNTATVITLASGFTAPPAAGDKIHIGRIKALLRTKAISLTKLSTKFRQRYLHVYYEPTTTAKELRVRIFEDYGSSAKTWDETIVDLTNGVSVTKGETDFRIDMSKNKGYARVPLGIDWNRVVEIEFEIRQQQTELNLVGFEIDGMAEEVQRLGG